MLPEVLALLYIQYMLCLCQSESSHRPEKTVLYSFLSAVSCFRLLHVRHVYHDPI